MNELTSLEKMMLHKLSEHHIVFMPRLPEQTSTLRNLQDRGLVKTTTNSLFGKMWALTDEGQKALEQESRKSGRRNTGYRTTYR